MSPSPLPAATQKSAGERSIEQFHQGDTASHQVSQPWQSAATYDHNACGSSVGDTYRGAFEGSEHAGSRSRNFGHLSLSQSHEYFDDFGEFDDDHPACDVNSSDGIETEAPDGGDSSLLSRTTEPNYQQVYARAGNFKHVSEHCHTALAQSPPRAKATPKPTLPPPSTRNSVTSLAAVPQVATAGQGREKERVTSNALPAKTTDCTRGLPALYDRAFEDSSLEVESEQLDDESIDRQYISRCQSFAAKKFPSFLDEIFSPPSQSTPKKKIPPLSRLRSDKLSPQPTQYHDSPSTEKLPHKPKESLQSSAYSNHNIFAFKQHSRPPQTHIAKSTALPTSMPSSTRGTPTSHSQQSSTAMQEAAPRAGSSTSRKTSSNTHQPNLLDFQKASSLLPWETELSGTAGSAPRGRPPVAASRKEALVPAAPRYIGKTSLAWENALDESSSQLHVDYYMYLTSDLFADRYIYPCRLMKQSVPAYSATSFFTAGPVKYVCPPITVA